MNQFDRITGVFNPKNTTDLQDNAERYIGQEIEWLASWVIEDGEYEGQMAMNPTDHTIKLGWVPECDIS